MDYVNRRCEGYVELAMLQKMPGISSLASASWLRSSDLALPDGGFNWPFVEAEAVELAGKCFLPDTSFANVENRLQMLIITAREKVSR